MFRSFIFNQDIDEDECASIRSHACECLKRNSPVFDADDFAAIIEADLFKIVVREYSDWPVMAILFAVTPDGQIAVEEGSSLRALITNVFGACEIAKQFCARFCRDN